MSRETDFLSEQEKTYVPWSPRSLNKGFDALLGKKIRRHVAKDMAKIAHFGVAKP